VPVYRSECPKETLATCTVYRIASRIDIAKMALVVRLKNSAYAFERDG